MTPYLFFLFPPPSPSLFRRTEKESCKVAGGGRGREKVPLRPRREGGRAVPEGNVAQHKAGKKLDAPLQAAEPPLSPPSAPAMYIERHIEKR